MRWRFFDDKTVKGQHLVLLAFLLLHTIIAAWHVSKQGITTDERAYYIYGIRWLHGQVERIEKQDDSKSPFVVFSAIPRSIIQAVHPNYKANDNGLRDMLMGRYCMVVYTLVIALYFFVWCRKLFGEKSWMVPLAFFLFDPLVLSYSMIIGTDMATGACMIAVFYHLYQFQKSESKKHFGLVSLWVGLSCVVKPSLIFLLPCIGLLYLVLWLARQVRFKPLQLAKYSLFILVTVLLVINVLYYFRASFSPLGSLPTQSIAFNRLQQHFPVFKKLPVPVPATYYASVDLLQYHKEIGGGTAQSSYPGVYLNGDYHAKGGFWYYYFVMAWYKLPLITLLFFVFALLSGVINFNRRVFFERHIWYVWPLFFFLFVLSFLNSFQIGFRHVLSIYPLCFLGVAAFFKRQVEQYKWANSLGWASLVLLLVPVALYFPDLMAFTNPLAGNKKMVYQKINDSSIDYGQALTYIPAYIENHPGVKAASAEPRPGRYIVPMQYLHKGNLEVGDRYQWYLNFKPVDHYRYSLLIYDISEKGLEEVKMAK